MITQLYQNSGSSQPGNGPFVPADFFTARRLTPADFPALLCVPANKQYEWRTQIPNLIDDLPISVYAHRLYFHVKRHNGEKNKRHCHENTKTLAAKCRMSTGQISAAKAELLRWGLVEIVPGSKREGTADEITIVDVWAINYDFYSQLAARKKSEGVHHMNPRSRLLRRLPNIRIRKQQHKKAARPICPLPHKNGGMLLLLRLRQF